MVSGMNNDNWLSRQNSMRLYGRLLQAGIEIYEYKHTMLHHKTMVVDGVWATVGTTNFDNRSFAHNEESNVCFYDAALVERMERSSGRTCARVTRIDLARGGSVECSPGLRSSWRRSSRNNLTVLEDDDSVADERDPFPPAGAALREPNGLLAAGGDCRRSGCSTRTAGASFRGSATTIRCCGGARIRGWCCGCGSCTCRDRSGAPCGPAASR